MFASFFDGVSHPPKGDALSWCQKPYTPSPHSPPSFWSLIILSIKKDSYQEIQYIRISDAEKGKASKQL